MTGCTLPCRCIQVLRSAQLKTINPTRIVFWPQYIVDVRTSLTASSASSTSAAAGITKYTAIASRVSKFVDSRASAVRSASHVVVQEHCTVAACAIIRCTIACSTLSIALSTYKNTPTHYQRFIILVSI